MAQCRSCQGCAAKIADLCKSLNSGLLMDNKAVPGAGELESVLTSARLALSWPWRASHLTFDSARPPCTPKISIICEPA